MTMRHQIVKESTMRKITMRTKTMMIVTFQYLFTNKYSVTVTSRVITTMMTKMNKEIK